VRAHNVKVHRLFGWFGTGLAGTMIVLGFVIAVVMARFDWYTLHEPGTEVFLSVPWGDMIEFGPLVALAVLWRREPELLLIATCVLLDAAFGRNNYLFDHNLYYVGVDVVILLGVGRDLLVNRSVHKVYPITLPTLIVCQTLQIYLFRGAPAWWHTVTSRIVA
jgi:hypothetical protein